jgi:ParB-like chromosome segregation protein Spo0J
MKITLVSISSLNPAEYNPRQITNKQYLDLKSSMEKFGCVDPIIININPERLNVVVGGHQRLRILRELGAEKVPTVSVNLSEEDERELNVRLNKSGGDWDMEILANEFDIVDLKDWGFKDTDFGFNIDKINPQDEWGGMPEFNQDDKMPIRQIIISFENKEDINKFSKLLNQNITDKTKSLWYPKKEKNVLKDKGYE